MCVCVRVRENEVHREIEREEGREEGGNSGNRIGLAQLFHVNAK